MSSQLKKTSLTHVYLLTPSLLNPFLESEIIVPGSGKSIEKLGELLWLNVVLEVGDQKQVRIL